MNIEDNYNFGGWKNCIRMYNEEVELVCTTEVGPRVVRFGFIGEQNLFKEFKSEQGKTGGTQWRSYGGHRLWHSPEAKPRTYYPDNEPVDYSLESNTIILTQQTETSTGLQKQIEISFTDTNRVKVIHRIINHNLWDIRFAPWSLTVMNVKGRAIIPQEPYVSLEERLTPVRPMALWGYTDMSDSRWIWGKKYIQLIQDPGQPAQQKLGVLNKLGWIAYVLEGQVFIKRYPYHVQALYPDYGVNTEIYTDADILEMETLGSFQEIAPRNYAHHTEHWAIFKAEVGTGEESIEQNLIPLINPKA